MGSDFDVILGSNSSYTTTKRHSYSIIIGTVYHPPSAVDALMLDFLSKNMSSIEARFPDSGIILLGDFNKLDTSRLKNNLK